MGTLTGKTAVITGSTSGIGLAYARAMAKAGANIVLNGMGKPEDIEKERGAQVEVIDLRTLNPLDVDTIIASVEKTGRAIVVQEAQRSTGVAAEVIAQINEKAILHLHAPVLRVTSPDIWFSFPTAEDDWVPNPKRVVDGLKQVLDF